MLDREHFFRMVGLPEFCCQRIFNRGWISFKIFRIFECLGRSSWSNLVPADIRKRRVCLWFTHCNGNFLQASEQVDFPVLHDTLFMASFSLDGNLPSVKGGLAYCNWKLVSRRFSRDYPTPPKMLKKLPIVIIWNIIGVETLQQVLDFSHGWLDIIPRWPIHGRFFYHSLELIMSFGFCQMFKRSRKHQTRHGNRWLRGHNVIMIGPPAREKLMLAKRLSSSLRPPLTLMEALETD